MFLDKRNKNKVAIIKELRNIVIVKDLKTGKRYLVEKENLMEIKVGE